MPSILQGQATVWNDTRNLEEDSRVDWMNFSRLGERHHDHYSQAIEEMNGVWGRTPGAVGMTWTTEKPTMAGHYSWVVDGATSTVIKLDAYGEWFKPGCAGPFIPPSRSQFAGPIECPPILLEPLP